MDPDTPRPDDDELDKRTPLERLADHGTTILTWAAIGFVISAVFLFISLYRKFNNA